VVVAVLEQIHKGGNVALIDEFATIGPQVLPHQTIICGLCATGCFRVGRGLASTKRGQNQRHTSNSVHDLKVGAILALATGLLMFAVGDVWSQMLLPQSAFEDLPIESTSSRLARNDAIRNFPLEKISPEARQRVEFVLKKPTFFRHIVVHDLECDPDLFLFLVRNPEILVNIWELMGVTHMQVLRSSRHQLHVDDGQGTVSAVEMMYGSPTVHIVHADGTYEGPLFGRTLKAKCAFLLNTQYARHADGRLLVRCQLDVFVRVENVGAGLLTKTLRPIASRMADYNFSESMQFISQISKASVNNGPGMQRLAKRLTGVEPEVQKRFTRLTATVSDGQRTVATEVPARVIGSSVLATTGKPDISVTSRRSPPQLRRPRFLQRQ